MVNQLFTDGYGRLTLDRYAFQRHIEGFDPSFNTQHNADKIKVNPTLTLNSVPNIADVQTALTQVGLELGTLELSGKGFITIGDGYDTYRKSNREELDYNASLPYDSTVPAFNTYLSNLLNISDPLDPNYNHLYVRIRSGGIVLIKTGTYIFTDTVNVPPGIILMGEGYGTKIINATSLNLAASPPDVLPGTEKPLFRIKIDINRTSNDGAVDASSSGAKFVFGRETIISNLVIADNFVEPTQLGDVNYQKPQNGLAANIPLIIQESGSHLILDNVILLGRTLFTVSPAILDATAYAIKLDAVVTTGTYLKITNSFIDGFAQPISFLSLGGRNDYLEITNSKIRSHGYLASDGIAQGNNCIVQMNDNNAMINDNEFYGNHPDLYTICYIKNRIATPAAYNASAISVINNNFNGGIDSLISDAIPVQIDAAIISTPSAFSDNAKVIVYGNNFNIATTTFKLNVDTNNIIEATGTTLTGRGNTVSLRGTTLVENIAGQIEDTATNDILLTAIEGNITAVAAINASITAPNIYLLGSQYVLTKTITATPYVVDTSTKDYAIFVQLSTIAATTTITLPAPSNGRELVIKDMDGLASTYNIILDPRSGLCDSYASSNADATYPIEVSTDTSVGQSFTGDGKTIISAQFMLKKTGAPFGTYSVKVFAHSGTFGSTGIPTGAALAESDALTTTGLTGSSTLYTFNFTGANNITLVNGTNYFIAIETACGSPGNTIDVSYDGSGSTHAGNIAVYNGAIWGPTAGVDAIFYVTTSDKIDGTSSTTTVSAPYGSYRLLGDGTNWNLV
jgi:hypothetical protein